MLTGTLVSLRVAANSILIKNLVVSAVVFWKLLSVTLVTALLSSGEVPVALEEAAVFKRPVESAIVGEARYTHFV